MTDKPPVKPKKAPSRADQLWEEVMAEIDAAREAHFDVKPDKRLVLSLTPVERLHRVQQAVLSLSSALIDARAEVAALEQTQYNVSRVPEAWFESLLNKYEAGLNTTRTEHALTDSASVAIRIKRQRGSARNRWALWVEFNRSQEATNTPVVLACAASSTLIDGLSRLTPAHDTRPVHEQIRKDLVEALFRHEHETITYGQTPYAALCDAAEYFERGDVNRGKTALMTAMNESDEEEKAVIAAFISRITPKQEIHEQVRTQLIYRLFPAENRNTRPEWQNQVYNHLALAARAFEQGSRYDICWAHIHDAAEYVLSLPADEGRDRVMDALVEFMKAGDNPVWAKKKEA